MKIRGLKGLSEETLAEEIENGARFVRYAHTVSLLVYSSRVQTSPHLILPDRSSLLPGLKYSLISLLFGWWAFPRGPIHTIEDLMLNFSGGMDVTAEVLASFLDPGDDPRQFSDDLDALAERPHPLD